MAHASYEEALDNSIGLVDKGLTIEECLLTYPEYAAQLLGPLQAAQTLQNGRSRLSIPSPTMRRDAFLGAVATQARADASIAATAGVRPVAKPRSTSPLWAPLRRFAMVPYALPAVLAMLVLGGAAWGVSAATGNSGPGSWIGSGGSHDDRVEVRGTITAISPTSVTVATLDGDVTAAITGDTEFEGKDGAPALIDDFGAGDTVKLSAKKAVDGSLVARELEHEEGGDDAAEATAGPDEADDDNRGPGNAEDGDDDNRGPGNAEDGDDDNRGPGNAEDGDDDNRGPGNAEDGDDDNRGPGDGGGGDDDGDDDDD